tara:strand:+ start:257 stop:490 length:234 start_codon:yes stop_codon:yes gene_type:complete
MFISKNGWILVHQDSGERTVKSEMVKSFRDESYILEGGNPPHKPSSQGKVWVSLLGNKDFNRELYPSVFGLKWVESD